jgi:hypothetical protein
MSHCKSEPYLQQRHFTVNIAALQAAENTIIVGIKKFGVF